MTSCLANTVCLGAFAVEAYCVAVSLRAHEKSIFVFTSTPVARNAALVPCRLVFLDQFMPVAGAAGAFDGAVSNKIRVT